MRSLIKQLKSDESLMRDYQRGDSLAFDMLYQRHKDKLFNFIYRSCQHPESVEDIAHDTWMSIIRAAERYKPTAKFTTYLYQIARNKIIDHWRQNTRSDLGNAEVDQIQADERLYNNPDDNAEQLQLINELMNALLKLPHEQREAFLLKEEGFSQKEIAEITDSKPETVKSRVRYARQQLQTLMGAAA